jgi:hypothetical protein
MYVIKLIDLVVFFSQIKSTQFFQTLEKNMHFMYRWKEFEEFLSVHALIRALIQNFSVQDRIYRK